MYGVYYRRWFSTLGFQVLTVLLFLEFSMLFPATVPGWFRYLLVMVDIAGILLSSFALRAGKFQ
ncbi:MAG TPA: hypothetical protein VFN35_19020 [Ktedonobacteraceae bacterium]|nr:hypothetical protein [Ktedonobacteraceae bacterium]